MTIQNISPWIARNVAALRLAISREPHVWFLGPPTFDKQATIRHLVRELAEAGHAVRSIDVRDCNEVTEQGWASWLVAEGGGNRPDGEKAALDVIRLGLVEPLIAEAASRGDQPPVLILSGVDHILSRGLTSAALQFVRGDPRLRCIATSVALPITLGTDAAAIWPERVVVQAGRAGASDFPDAPEELRAGIVALLEGHPEMCREAIETLAAATGAPPSALGVVEARFGFERTHRLRTLIEKMIDGTAAVASRLPTDSQIAVRSARIHRCVEASLSGRPIPAEDRAAAEELERVGAIVFEQGSSQRARPANMGFFFLLRAVLASAGDKIAKPQPITEDPVEALAAVFPAAGMVAREQQDQARAHQAKAARSLRYGVAVAIAAVGIAFLGATRQGKAELKQSNDRVSDVAESSLVTQAAVLSNEAAALSAQVASAAATATGAASADPADRDRIALEQLVLKTRYDDLSAKEREARAKLAQLKEQRSKEERDHEAAQTACKVAIDQLALLRDKLIGDVRDARKATEDCQRDLQKAKASAAPPPEAQAAPANKSAAK